MCQTMFQAQGIQQTNKNSHPHGVSSGEGADNKLMVPSSGKKKSKAVSKEQTAGAECFSWVVRESLSGKFYLNKDLKEIGKQTTQISGGKAKALMWECAWHYQKTSRRVVWLKENEQRQEYQEIRIKREEVKAQTTCPGLPKIVLVHACYSDINFFKMYLFI